MTEVMKLPKPPIFPPLALGPADELATFRPDMVRFARLQLRDHAIAEDVVQESLTAALTGLDDFRSGAKLKTWVFAILKNKIIDAMRDRARTAAVISEPEADSDDLYAELFDAQGRWHDDTRPSNWGDPEACFRSQQFWQVFDACLSRLPENTARVFMMREVLGFTTEAICTELRMSSANCWVILHRARMALRLCLDERWFKTGGHDHAL